MAITAKPSLRWEVVDGTYRRYPDGRQVCCDNVKGKAEYARRTEEMALRQGKKCCICRGPFFDTPTFEHSKGRGMNAAHRDDRTKDERGSWMNGAAHSWCNGEKGSRRA